MDRSHSRRRPLPEKTLAEEPLSEEHLEAALEEVRGRLRKDAALFKDDEEVQALFTPLEERLFETDFDVNDWITNAECSREARDRFVKCLGPLKLYLDECRVTAAAKLLRETSESVDNIGPKVGIDVARTLRRAFKRVLGQPPSAVRRPSGETVSGHAGPQSLDDGESRPESGADDPTRAGEPEVERGTSGEVVSPRTESNQWRRWISLGMCDLHRAGDVLHQLRRRYPHLRQDAEQGADEDALPAWVARPVVLNPVTGGMDFIAASTILKRVLELPRAERRHAMIHGIRWTLDVGFPLIHQIALSLAPSRRELGLELAEIAVEMCDSHFEGAGPAAVDWRALTWGLLAEVRTKAGDLAGADQAVTFAKAEWEVPREETWPQVEVRLWRVEGALRRIQRRCGEARDLLDRALAACRESDPEDERSASSLRGECCHERLRLALTLGEAETALELLDEIETLSDDSGSAGRHLALARAKVHALAGNAEQSLSFLARYEDLEKAQALVSPPEIRLDKARIHAVAGQFEQAETLVQSALEDWEESGDELGVAVATAELATLFLLSGNREPRRIEAFEAARLLEALPLHREARLAAHELRSMATAEEVEAHVLDELRRWLDLVLAELPHRLQGRRSDAKETA